MTSWAARLVMGLLVGLTCALVVASVVVAFGGRAEPRPVIASPADSPDAQRPAGSPREALRRWDKRRAAAWEAGDVTSLGELYTPRSGAGHRDVAMLEAWCARGLRVTRMTTQVLSLAVAHADSRRLILRVSDRLVDVRAGLLALPRDAESTRRIELRRAPGGRWRVASVTDVAPSILRRGRS